MSRERLPKDVENAKKLFLKREYAKVISSLLSFAHLYKENFEYHYYLGYSYFMLKDYRSARIYLRIASGIERNKTEPLLILAYTAIYQNNLQEAISYYLRIQDMNKNSTSAALGLEIVKDISSKRYTFNELETSDYKYKILPKEGGLKFSKRMLIIPLVIVLGFGIYFYIPNITNLYKEIVYKILAKREMVKSLEFKKEEILLSSSPITGYKYSLSVSELEKIVKEMKMDFVFKKDNSTRININRIVYSNASEDTKAKALSYIKYLSDYDFTTFSEKDFIHYKEVQLDPQLYEGVFVKWKGRVSNLSRDKNLIKFNLLVGYEDLKIVQGIVYTYFDKAIEINDGIAVEVLGKINLVENSEDSFALQGYAIREIR